MLEKSSQWWLIWYLLFFCHGGAEGQLQWVVKEKVTAYGQNLILFSPIENCCSEPAGWSVGPKAIILDVKTFSNDPKVKYHGTYDKDGFGVVIRNLSEADLDVTYRCIYGFDQSKPKLLLYGDVFRERQLQWVVKEKVTGYGQNLILLCPVENCCIEPAGWDVGPNAIILDVKTFSNDPKVKYHGTYNKDGFGVVIHNLSEADLNVTYRCVYGFDQSTPKYLLHDDVFRDNVPDKDKEIDTTAFVVPIVVIMVGFIIGIMTYCVYRSRTCKKKEALYRSNIQIEIQQDETNRTKKMEDIIYVHAPISYGTNEIWEIPTGHSKGLDRLRIGPFKITPLAYRMATLFVSGLSGALVRWSEGYNKYTNFTFRETIVDGKTYFHIFSADCSDYFVKMGMFSYVRCEKGDPEGCNDATWEIKCGEYNNGYRYILCTKDSNDNYLSANRRGNMHGRRGDINERRLFFIH